MKNFYMLFISCFILSACNISKQENGQNQSGVSRLEEFSANSNWIVSCRDNREKYGLDIYLENDQYSIIYQNDGQSKKCIMNGCTKGEQQSEGTKHWKEKINFADKNINITLTIYGGQDIGEPIVTQVSGSWEGTSIQIDTTWVLVQYNKTFNVQQSNLKNTELQCSTPFKVSVPFYIDYKGDNNSTREEFVAFWVKFRDAVKSNDTKTIIQQSNLPFITKSPIDDFSDIEYDKQDELLIVLDEFFYQDALGCYLGISGFSEKFESYVAGTLLLNDSVANIADMTFYKIDSRWKFALVDLQPATYMEMDRILQTHNIKEVSFAGASFMPELSMLSFVTADGKKIDFYIQDTPIDAENNEFFDSKTTEGSIFPEFVTKPGIEELKYVIYYYTYERAVPLAEDEKEEYLKLKKYLKL